MMKPIYQKIFERAKPFLRTRKNLIHTRIALRYAIKLLETVKGDEEVVIPAILLHDVGWKAVPKICSSRLLVRTDRILKRQGFMKWKGKDGQKDSGGTPLSS